MSRSCSICTRSDAGAINALLGEGRSARSIALDLGLSEDAVQRHAQRHAARAIPRPRPAPAAGGDALDELVTALRLRALAGNPTDTREYRLALAAQADVRHAVPPTRDLASEPEWLLVRALILAALEPYLQARIAIAAALGDI